jgi:hypothetical protein
VAFGALAAEVLVAIKAGDTRDVSPVLKFPPKPKKPWEIAIAWVRPGEAGLLYRWIPTDRGGIARILMAVRDDPHCPLDVRQAAASALVKIQGGEVGAKGGSDGNGILYWTGAA